MVALPEPPMLTQEEAPQARHVAVSADNQPSTVLEAIDAAACGYLPQAADCAWIHSFGPWPGLKRTTG